MHRSSESIGALASLKEAAQAFANFNQADIKTVMRQMDVEVAPLREQAERLASEYLMKRGLAPDAAAEEPRVARVARSEGDGVEETKRPAPGRVLCGTCGASNEADAAFCKQCGARVKEAGGA